MPVKCIIRAYFERGAMYIEKRSNKLYRVVVKQNKTTYRLDFSFKPTKKDIYEKLERKIAENDPKNKRFIEYAKLYVSTKSNILSPTTIYDYTKSIEYIPSMLLDAKLSDIDHVLLQQAINILANRKGARTVQKIKTFILSVLRIYRPDSAFKVFIPKVIKKAQYLPTIEDVSKIIEHARNTQYESALLLAAFGLRKSEICGLTTDDIYENYIIIRQVKIRVGNKFVLKDTTKNHDKNPIVYIPKEILDRIRKIGLYTGYPDAITTYLYRTQKKLNIPKFSVHKLRHFYPSLLHLYGVPDKYAMKQGRWKTNQVLKEVYQDTYDSEMEKVLDTPHKVIIENVLK